MRDGVLLSLEGNKRLTCWHKAKRIVDFLTRLKLYTTMNTVITISALLSSERIDQQRIHPAVNERTFPIIGEVSENAEPVRLGKDVSSSKEAIKELGLMGYRPATLPELLAWGDKTPVDQFEGSTFALGTRRKFQCFGNQEMFALLSPSCRKGQWDKTRQVELALFELGWPKSVRYLAVKEQYLLQFLESLAKYSL